MKKYYYYTPEVKFHKLRTNAVMQVTSPGQASDEIPIGNPEEDADAGAKGFGSFSFDED